jgi:hypothetical protein
VLDREHYNLSRSDDPHFDERLPLEPDDADPFAMSTSEDEPEEEEELSDNTRAYKEAFDTDTVERKEMRARGARFRQKTERELRKEQGDAEYLYPFLLEHDGSYLMGFPDGAVVEFAADGTGLAEWQAHKSRVTSLFFEEETELLVSTSADGEIVLVNLETSDMKSMEGVPGKWFICCCLKWSTLVAQSFASDESGELFVWNTQSGALLQRLDLGWVEDFLLIPQQFSLKPALLSLFVATGRRWKEERSLPWHEQLTLESRFYNGSSGSVCRLLQETENGKFLESHQASATSQSPFAAASSDQTSTADSSDSNCQADEKHGKTESDAFEYLRRHKRNKVIVFISYWLKSFSLGCFKGPW